MISNVLHNIRLSSSYNKTHHHHGSKGERVITRLARSKTTRLRATCFGPSPTVPAVITISIRRSVCGGSLLGSTIYLADHAMATAVSCVANSVGMAHACRYVLYGQCYSFVSATAIFNTYLMLIVFLYDFPALVLLQDFEAPDREICFCFPDKSDTLCGKNTKCVEDEDDYQDVGTCQCQDDGYGGDPVLRTSPDGGCTDIDECALGDVCGPNGECENSVGSFRCNCALGYFWEPPQGGCKDRDECEQDTAPCGPNGVCTNTPGSFTCGCEPGFTGDPLNGDNCKDIDGRLLITKVISLMLLI